MTYVIPADLQCTHCTLQWYLATGNTCAYDQDYFEHDPGFKFWAFYKMSWATCATSCCTSKIWGEEFWNCADIAVTGGTGGPSPTPPAPMPTPTPPSPMPTPMPTPPTPTPPGNKPGVLTPAEFAKWSQKRGVVAKACKDDEDFKDPLDYSCADWDGYCFTKLLDYASDYTPQDILNIIFKCPKTCDASCQEPEPEPEPKKEF